jgi:hypothetical protein
MSICTQAMSPENLLPVGRYPVLRASRCCHLHRILVGGEARRDGAFHTTRPDSLPVVMQAGLAALGQPTAVVVPAGVAVSRNAWVHRMRIRRTGTCLRFSRCRAVAGIDPCAFRPACQRQVTHVMQFFSGRPATRLH